MLIKDSCLNSSPPYLLKMRISVSNEMRNLMDSGSFSDFQLVISEALSLECLLLENKLDREENIPFFGAISSEIILISALFKLKINLKNLPSVVEMMREGFSSYSFRWAGTYNF